MNPTLVATLAVSLGFTHVAASHTASSAWAVCQTSRGFADAQDTAAWKTLSSRSGWRIKYPPTWSAWSCRNCSDLTAPGVYVTFGQPSSSSGTVMVEVLARRPQRESITDWLAEVKRSANQNPILAEDTISVAGRRALRVRYKNTGMGVEMEAIYLVAGRTTLSISFDAERPGVQLEDLPNYRIYQRMLDTFELQKR